MVRSCLMPVFPPTFEVLVPYCVSGWHLGCSLNVLGVSLGWAGQRNQSEKGGCHGSDDAVDGDEQSEAGARTLLRAVWRAEARRVPRAGRLGAQHGRLRDEGGAHGQGGSAGPRPQRHPDLAAGAVPDDQRGKDSGDDGQGGALSPGGAVLWKLHAQCAASRGCGWKPSDREFQERATDSDAAQDCGRQGYDHSHQGGVARWDGDRTSTGTRGRRPLSHFEGGSGTVARNQSSEALEAL